MQGYWIDSGNSDRWSKFCKKSRRVGREDEIRPVDWQSQTGMSPPRWARYEKGKAPQTIGHLFEVADALGISCREIIEIVRGKPLDKEDASTPAEKLAKRLIPAIFIDAIKEKTSKELVDLQGMIGLELFYRAEQ